MCVLADISDCFLILFDPSKCCHQVKKLDTSMKNAETEKPIDNLTWQLDAGNIKKMKLRTGQVAWKKSVKEKKTKISHYNIGHKWSVLAYLPVQHAYYLRP